MAMRFEHEFTVPVPVEQAWPVLLDVERVAPCLPGAAVDKVEGDSFTGRMKVKVGPITVTYQGEAAFENVDADTHSLTMKASGKEARGAGTAGATVVARLHPADAVTRVTVDTTFNVTGRPAQFGRGVMAEVGAKLIERFAANLADLLGKSPAAEPATTAHAPEPATAPHAPEPATAPHVAEPATTAPTAAQPATPTALAVSETGSEASVAETAAGSEAEEFPAISDTTGPGPVRPAGTAAEETGRRRHLSAVSTPPGRTEEVPPRESHPAGTARTSLTPDEEALNLLQVAGIPLLKRIAPLLAALTAVALIAWLVRRAGHRH
ncbi:SRPBCC family protein [Streptosporangium fragile]|uniref:SRPBCC family protein n=1 Tax=Streptosporangium fragile TaxID=46186 RepID=A0ABN3W4B5_9ACTN